MTVYWVVWDAGAHWVVDKLEREGALPAVSAMRERGTIAAARPARPNCQTPPSLATLFTGTWPSEHGVTGYTVPGAGEGIASHVSGFSPGFPAVPPVWETLSESDLRSAFVHTPWVFDEAGALGPHIDGAVEAYSRRLIRHSVREIASGIGAHRWAIGAYEVDAEVWADGRVRVRSGAQHDVLLVAGGGWQQLPLDDDGHGTWVACVRTPERLLLVHTGVWAARTGGSNRALVGRLRGLPPFAGEGVGPLYRVGTFGRRLAEGGDGSAEEVLLSSVGCVAQSFGAAADAVLKEHDADLVVVYLPMTDDIGHELLGWCDEKSGVHRPDIADAVWSYLRRCYQWSDDILGRVLDRADPGDTVVLGADHGMVGSTHLVHLNEQLVREGLAVLTADGALDPYRSEVFYHPANNGSLWTTDLAADPGRAHDAMERAQKALRAITDPETGHPVVAGFIDADGAPLPAGGGDPTVAYVVLADDYQPAAGVLGPDEGPVTRRVLKTGAHVVSTGDARLHAIHLAVGPGIAAGGDRGVVDNTLPARLVLRQLGAEPAATAGPQSIASEPTDERCP
ncbi:type I phosphodiesterase/nucleotide pyrophosphatase [Streptomyces sp. SLBN-118]|uniref:alkaline phosphatase family protein n=1 Tax=Streptomyces sp. SLBN-118 TaxID=2768454 RepID=UPI00116ADA96|nr:alkaline phosphatase family protein [Streptomyces sp. SLBN-118]TQK51143.1 type I phosphodiesterase/nucleotide pyrophosphatase [Streptomyces sp. SLBN-118]